MPINKGTKGTRAPASNNVLTSGNDLVKRHKAQGAAVGKATDSALLNILAGPSKGIHTPEGRMRAAVDLEAWTRGLK